MQARALDANIDSLLYFKSDTSVHGEALFNTSFGRACGRIGETALKDVVLPLCEQAPKIWSSLHGWPRGPITVSASRRDWAAVKRGVGEYLKQREHSASA